MFRHGSPRHRPVVPMGTSPRPTANPHHQPAMSNKPSQVFSFELLRPAPTQPKHLFSCCPRQSSQHCGCPHPSDYCKGGINPKPAPKLQGKISARDSHGHLCLAPVGVLVGSDCKKLGRRSCVSGIDPKGTVPTKHALWVAGLLGWPQGAEIDMVGSLVLVTSWIGTDGWLPGLSTHSKQTATANPQPPQTTNQTLVLDEPSQANTATGIESIQS